MCNCINGHAPDCVENRIEELEAKLSELEQDRDLWRDRANRIANKIHASQAETKRLRSRLAAALWAMRTAKNASWMEVGKILRDALKADAEARATTNVSRN